MPYVFSGLKIPYCRAGLFSARHALPTLSPQTEGIIKPILSHTSLLHGSPSILLLWICQDNHVVKWQNFKPLPEFVWNLISNLNLNLSMDLVIRQKPSALVDQKQPKYQQIIPMEVDGKKLCHPHPVDCLNLRKSTYCFWWDHQEVIILKGKIIMCFFFF